MDAEMKTGQRVDFYIYRGRHIKQMAGVLLAFNELEGEVLPDGKKTSVRVPIAQIRGI